MWSMVNMVGGNARLGAVGAKRPDLASHGAEAQGGSLYIDILGGVKESQ
jgi:hypothetical protein